MYQEFLGLCLSGGAEPIPFMRCAATAAHGFCSVVQSRNLDPTVESDSVYSWRF